MQPLQVTLVSFAASVFGPALVVAHSPKQSWKWMAWPLAWPFLDKPVVNSGGPYEPSGAIGSRSERSNTDPHLPAKRLAQKSLVIILRHSLLEM